MALRDQVTGLSHIGNRVHELALSRAFYELLGFEFTWGPSGPENVCALPSLGTRNQSHRQCALGGWAQYFDGCAG